MSNEFEGSNKFNIKSNKFNIKANEFRRLNKLIDKFEHPMHVYAKSDKFAKGHSLTTTKKKKEQLLMRWK